jgi:hypothetical protein
MLRLNLRRLACSALAAFFLLCFAASAQVATTGSILGVVKDPSSAIVPNAAVVCVGMETGSRLETKTTDAGAYVCPNLVEGMYLVEVVASGFVKAVVSNVKVSVATAVSLDVRLEVGATSEVVQVDAQATPVVTATTAIATTIVGRQIMELPLSTRSALDFAFQMPGAAGGGGPRYSSFEGLPHGALNVAIDGINVQDNLLKSSSGGSFYTYITPRIDAVDEVTVSSAANAASAGEGAVQITFVTKRGTNEWHGGVFEQVRNDYFNANTWFNNKNRLPRQVLRLNQFGGRLGGPIIKNKLFIFGVWDDFRLPNAISRTRTVLKTAAIGGDFTYKGSDGLNHTVNVLQVAAGNGLRSTPDANIGALLRKIDALRTGGQVGITPSDLFRDTMTFNNVGSQRRYFPTTRLDYVINEKMSLEAEWYYQGFRSFPDTLNSYDRTYPGFETLNGKPAQGAQNSNRHQTSLSFRWTPGATVSNELRFGENGGTVVFAGGMDQSLYPNNTRLGWPLSLTSPLSLPRDSRRNTPFLTLQDNLTWQKSEHTLNFGVSYNRMTPWDRSIGTAVPLASLGIQSTDPAAAMFNTTNFPSIQSADISNAQNLYALLTGRISGISGVVNVDENSHAYVPYAPLTVRNFQQNFGLFFTDNFRVRPSVTLNYGLRWDYQGVPGNTNGVYTMPQGGYAGLYDVSGQDNLFKPGALTGQATSFVIAGQAWNKHYRNFAPSVGVVWSPGSDQWLSNAIFGKGGALRVGYSITYSREGLAHLTQMEGANPGPTATATLTADVDFPAGTMFYDGKIPPLTLKPTSFSFPLSYSPPTYSGASSNWYDPNLAPPRVHSYSIGIQREIARDTVLEVRYVGNYGQNLWRQYNLNEANIVENKFVQEFRAAQNNYNICAANRLACTGSAAGTLRFDNRGVAGQVDLPILNAAFKSNPNSFFTSSSFITNLQQGTAGSMASTLGNNKTYMDNLTAAGYARNFFLVNPTMANGGAWLLSNGAWSNYNSLQVEVRRRTRSGLAFMASYVYSKGLSNLFGDAQSSATQPYTLRNFSLGDGPSPYDIRHAFKMNWMYDLPFGPGKRFAPWTNGILSRLVGGWTFDGVARIQSGQAIQLTSSRGTLNQFDGGVLPMVPMSQIQSMANIHKSGNGVVTLVDSGLIGSDGRANPAYLQVPTMPGQLGYEVFLYGPPLVRVDSSIVKRTRINERFNMELRAQVLNVLNAVNFMACSASSSTCSLNITSTTFGQTTNYYQDFNGSQDPGGRVVELVFRLNF